MRKRITITCAPSRERRARYVRSHPPARPGTIMPHPDDVAHAAHLRAAAQQRAALAEPYTPRYALGRKVRPCVPVVNVTRSSNISSKQAEYLNGTLGTNF